MQWLESRMMVLAYLLDRRLFSNCLSLVGLNKMPVCKRKRDWIENFMPSWKVVGKGRNKIPCTAFHHIVYIKAVYCNCFYFNFFFCFIEYKKRIILKKKKQTMYPPLLIIYRHRWSYYAIKFLAQKRHLQANSLLKYWDKI